MSPSNAVSPVRGRGYLFVIKQNRKRDFWVGLWTICTFGGYIQMRTALGSATGFAIFEIASGLLSGRVQGVIMLWQSWKTQHVGPCEQTAYRAR